MSQLGNDKQPQGRVDTSMEMCRQDSGWGHKVEAFSVGRMKAERSGTSRVGQQVIRLRNAGESFMGKRRFNLVVERVERQSLNRKG